MNNDNNNNPYSTIRMIIRDLGLDHVGLTKRVERAITISNYMFQHFYVDSTAIYCISFKIFLSSSLQFIFNLLMLTSFLNMYSFSFRDGYFFLPPTHKTALWLRGVIVWWFVWIFYEIRRGNKREKRRDNDEV